MTSEERHDTSGKNQPKTAERLKQSFRSIDRQAPILTYLGFGCWMAWNTIGFSGAFWLHDTESSIRSENLVLVHLAGCIVTLLLLSIFAKRVSRFAAKNLFTFVGALIATAGTLLIIITRESIFPSQTLFLTGCVLSGIGTTVLFFRAAALFGSLPPHRSLYMLILCQLFSLMVYFVFASCPNEVATAGFLLLPLASAALFSLRSRNVLGESTVLKTHIPLPRKFMVMLLSIGLCSMALELTRSYILIKLPPSYSIESATTAQLIAIPVMLITLILILLSKSIRGSFAKLYSIIAGALTATITIMSVLSLYSPLTASISWIVCTCFNIIVWAILFYLVYQTQANALELLGFGNAALSIGTLAGGLLSYAYYETNVNDEIMRVILTVLGIVVLIDVLFVFSERQINALLLPVDDQVKQDETRAKNGKAAGKWVSDVRALAKQYRLSARETEVFVSLSRGRSAQEIADLDFLSIYTVRAHIRSIYAKLDVHSRKELIEFIENNRGE